MRGEGIRRWSSRCLIAQSFIGQSRSMGSRSSTARLGRRTRPTLLLLHGLPSSSRMFEPLFARLADRYHLVAPDYPGFGHSDWPDPKQFDYTFDHIASVMEDFTQALGLSRYTLYMQDYGGPVGFRMALAHPERVQALIVQDAVAHNEGLGVNWTARRAFWADRGGKRRGAARRTCCHLRPRRHATSGMTRRSSSTIPTCGRTSTRSSTRRARRRSRATCSTTTAPTSMHIRSGRRGCRGRSRGCWCCGANTISRSMRASRNATARTCRVRRSTCSTRATSRSTPRQTRSPNWCVSS